MSPPTPTNWSSYMLELYLQPSVIRSVDVDKLEQKAREALKGNEGAFYYLYGSAGTMATYHANRMAFNTFKIVPHMLTDAAERDISTTIFGVKLPTPLLIAPVGVQGIWHADAELATARAANHLGVPFILSTASTRSIEEVAEANGDGLRWFQLYWPRTDAITISLLQRAKKNGFKVLVVTLDTMLLGWRPHDIETAYLPFKHGVGCQIGTSDPLFMARYNLQTVQRDHPAFPYDPVAMDKLCEDGDEAVLRRTVVGQGWIQEISSKFRTWKDLKFLKEHWDGPIVLKGIQRVEDAEKALEVGVDGIVVSSHGGRQVDGALASLFSLENICNSPRIHHAQKNNKFTVLFDSGVRTGSDIIKALALGAQGILLGRPWVYGLVLGGEKGVEHVVKHTLADLEITMGLCGYRSLDQIMGKRQAIAVKQKL